jgi:hypothetical protein
MTDVQIAIGYLVLAFFVGYCAHWWQVKRAKRRKFDKIEEAMSTPTIRKYLDDGPLDPAPEIVTLHGVGPIPASKVIVVSSGNIGRHL